MACHGLSTPGETSPEVGGGTRGTMSSLDHTATSPLGARRPGHVPTAPFAMTQAPVAGSPDTLGTPGNHPNAASFAWGQRWSRRVEDHSVRASRVRSNSVLPFSTMGTDLSCQNKETRNWLEQRHGYSGHGARGRPSTSTHRPTSSTSDGSRQRSSPSPTRRRACSSRSRAISKATC